jgi:hypothetical protein
MKYRVKKVEYVGGGTFFIPQFKPWFSPWWHDFIYTCQDQFCASWTEGVQFTQFAEAIEFLNVESGGQVKLLETTVYEVET